MADNSFPSDAADKFVVRLPEGMRDRIAEEAKASGRSMNAEIVARLQRSLSEGPTINGVSMNDLFKKLEALEAAVAARIAPPPFMETEAGKEWKRKTLERRANPQPGDDELIDAEQPAPKRKAKR